MKSFFALVLLALAVASASAFGGYTPVFASTPSSTTKQPKNGASSMEMRARVCDLLGKKPNRQARVVTFSHTRVKKVQQVNLQWKRYYSDQLGRKVRLRVSTKGIKTINKMGSIDEAAKKFDVDLKKF